MKILTGEVEPSNRGSVNRPRRMGVLKQDQIYAYISKQVDEIVFATLTVSDGTFFFLDGFDEAFDYYAAARELAEKYMGTKSVSASMVTGLTARLQYERGDVAGAEVAVLDALDLIEATAFHEGFRNAYFVLVRAAALRGDRARAMSLLNRAERLSWERGWGVVIAMLLVERTRVFLRCVLG